MRWSDTQWKTAYTTQQSRAHITRRQNASRPIHTLFPTVCLRLMLSILAGVCLNESVTLTIHITRGRRRVSHLRSNE
jgi:hypothetical protein